MQYKYSEKWKFYYNEKQVQIPSSLEHELLKVSK